MNAVSTFAPWLGVFETLRVFNGVPLFVAEHRAELSRAADALGLKLEFDFEKARAELPKRSGRWRWIVTPEGARTLFTEEAEVPVRPIGLSISPVRVGSQNWDARFKTLSYLSHAQAWQTAPTPEVVLLNEHGHVASASRGNIFWRRGKKLFTPAHEAGCRCGVVRDLVRKHVPVEIGHFSGNNLLEADEIFVTNSLRGIISANQFEERRIKSTDSAETLRHIYDEAVKAQS